ncbi:MULTISPECIES: hypothetical protein [Polaromonas]|uniref:PsiF repeat-containing protein n=1 Tax=Polaromonas aquatica TaxID=332657 RepID=A0ABW1U4G4_9BURK
METKNWMAKPAMALMVASALLLGGNVHAQAGDADKPAKAKTQKKKAAAAGGQGAKAKFMPGSQETRSERIARLKRECKGGVNAGACEGYTR